MPYPNEHACRLKDPGKYNRFRRGSRTSSNGKVYSIIFGILGANKSEEQAYRYNKTTWSASEARSHCNRHNGRFEAASTTKSREYILSKLSLFLNALKRHNTTKGKE